MDLRRPAAVTPLSPRVPVVTRNGLGDPPLNQKASTVRIRGACFWLRASQFLRLPGCARLEVSGTGTLHERC